MEEADRHLAQRRPGKRPPAYSMRALGRKNLPDSIMMDGVTWRHARTHKHDFWAVTGFYENDRGARAVLKMGRTEPFLGFGLEFIGRFLHGAFDRREGGHQNDQRVGGLLLDLTQNRQAVAVGQLEIEQGEVDPGGLLHRLGGRGRLHDPMTLAFVTLLQRPAQQSFVVDD